MPKYLQKNLINLFKVLGHLDLIRFILKDLCVLLRILAQ